MPFTRVDANRLGSSAEACEDCGALVPPLWQHKHMRFHPHNAISDPNGRCVLCILPESAGVHEQEPTPASVHAMRRRVERDENQFAWLHQCGHLNHGYWDDRSVCGGCRFSVEKADEVDGHYRLVPVEGLGDEGER